MLDKRTKSSLIGGGAKATPIKPCSIHKGLAVGCTMEIEVSEALWLSRRVAPRSRLRRTWRNTIVEDMYPPQLPSH